MLRRTSRAVPTYSELFFNRIKCSESIEVILCMDGDVTPEEDTKPYLDQVYGGRVIHFSTRQDLAAAEQYFPGYTITFEVVSSRTVGGFNHVYSPCYFYPRVCYVYLITVLLG